MKYLIPALDKIISGGPKEQKVEPHFVFHKRYYPWQSRGSILSYVSFVDHRNYSYEMEWCYLKQLIRRFYEKNKI